MATAGLSCFVAAALVTTSVAAQGSPYLSLDDPRLPLLEHLIIRGDVRDPSPQIRPLLISDVLAALRAAARDTSSPSAPVVRELLQAWDLPAGESWKWIGLHFGQVERNWGPVGLTGIPIGSYAPAILNPFLLITFGRHLGFGDRRNAMLGGDATWRPSKRLLLQVQGAADGRPLGSEVVFPNRFGLALLGAGALGSTLSWRVSYAMNSSLAYRTFDPNESFSDGGIGIGPPFTDNDHMLIGIGVPVSRHWLLSPQVQLLRRGEGRIDQPFPDEETASDLPTLFIGTRQELVGRIQATVGFRVAGLLQDWRGFTLILQPVPLHRPSSPPPGASTPSRRREASPS